MTTKTKISRTYRLSQKTLDQINWLSSRMGDLNATDVITTAVAELYEHKRAEEPIAHLLPTENGSYDLTVNGETLIRISENTLKQLPEEVKNEMLAGLSEGGEALTYLVLAAVKEDESIWVNKEAIARIFGIRTEID
jgi:hypothetical protein